MRQNIRKEKKSLLSALLIVPCRCGMKFLGMDAEVNGPTYNVVNASNNASNFLVNVYPNADGVDVVDDDNNVSMNCSNPYCYSDLDYLRLIQSHIFPDSIEWLLSRPIARSMRRKPSAAQWPNTTVPPQPSSEKGGESSFMSSKRLLGLSSTIRIR